MACGCGCSQLNKCAPRGLGLLGSFDDNDAGYDWYYDGYSDLFWVFDDGFPQQESEPLGNETDWFLDWDLGAYEAPSEADLYSQPDASIYTYEESYLPVIDDGNFPLYVPQENPLPYYDYDPWADVWADPPPTPPDAATPQLPGYCPQGYYHPLDNPLTCVPFPPSQQQTAAQKRQQRQQQQQARQQQQQQAKQQAAQQQQQRAQQCAQAGLVYNAKTQKCECPAGTKPNAQTRACERVSTVTPLVNRSNSASKNSLPWWVVLVGLGVAYKAVDGNGNTGRRRR